MSKIVQSEPNSPGIQPDPVQPNRAPSEPSPTPPSDLPETPRVKPDYDPDIPEHPGPPLSDPESPHGTTTDN